MRRALNRMSHLHRFHMFPMLNDFLFTSVNRYEYFSQGRLNVPTQFSTSCLNSMTSTIS